jgi:hypothetical protein
MIFMRRLLFAVLSVLAVMPAAADTLLVPVLVNREIPGAFGSLWMTRFAAANTGATPLIVHGAAPACNTDCVGPITDITLAAGESLSFLPYTTMEVPGKFIRVDANRAADLYVNLRVQDLSRQASTWGTQVPVVREGAAATARIELLDVPSAGDFRSLLRVYDFDPSPGHSVTVRVYRSRQLSDVPSADELLQETPLLLRVPSDPAMYPGYGELDISGLHIPPRQGSAPTSVVPVRIEIVPASPGLRFYAFASVTNNATQHVTIVAP